MSGWVRAHRIPPEHPLRQRWGLEGCYAWQELIHLANWKDHNELRRGQLLASLTFLQGLWRCNRSRVVRFLTWLEDHEMITRETQTGRKWTRITICNYEKYQAPRNSSDTRNRTVSGTTSVEERRKTNTTAAKRPDYSEEFEEAWSIYPKRAGGNPKKKAFKAWNARLSEGVKPEDLEAAVNRYAAYVRATGKEETEFVMQAATFFGPGEHWPEPYELPRDERRRGTHYAKREDLLP